MSFLCPYTMVRGISMWLGSAVGVGDADDPHVHDDCWQSLILKYYGNNY